jgi:hypothetical protein
VSVHFDSDSVQNSEIRLIRSYGDLDSINMAVGSPVQDIRIGFPGPTLILQRASPGSGRPRVLAMSRPETPQFSDISDEEALYDTETTPKPGPAESTRLRNLRNLY